MATVLQWLSRDTWFEPEQALAAGLVDVIVPPPPPTRYQLEQIASGAMPTAQQKLFQTFLTAFGPVEVSDRAEIHS